MQRTFDLSTLNLFAGIHSITVRAKANGYNNSDESNGLSYTVAPEASVSIEGLTYTLSDDGTYYICSGMDTESTATDIVIASTCEGLPVKEIGMWAFAFKSITSVTIPANITSIRNYAFSSCISLKSVYITDVEAWCKINFGDNNANPLSNAAKLYLNGELLTDLVIPDTVTEIKDDTFGFCTSITSVSIPSGMTTIGASAFASCSNLTSVYITDVATWCNISFGNYSANPLYYAKTLYLNGELITDLVIPDSVTSIGDWAFYKCSRLISVTIGNSVISIGNASFSDCTSLTDVTIGNTVTSVGEAAFYNCANLTDVYYSGSADQWPQISISDYNDALLNATIHYDYVLATPTVFRRSYTVFTNVENRFSTASTDNVSQYKLGLCSHYDVGEGRTVPRVELGVEGDKSVTFVNEFETLEDWEAFVAAQDDAGTPLMVDCIVNDEDVKRTIIDTSAFNPIIPVTPNGRIEIVTNNGRAVPSTIMYQITAQGGD